MRRLILVTLTIVATLFGIAIVWAFLPALELFGGSLALSAALRPLVRRLETRGIARGWAILIWYVALLVVVAGLVALFGLGLITDITTAIERFPSWYAALQQQLAQSGAVMQALAKLLPDLGQFSSGTAGASLFGGTAVGLAGSLVGRIVLVLATLSLSYYWLTESTHFERLWLSLLPVSTRVRARNIWRTAEGAVGSYIRSTLIAVVLASLLLLGWYTLLAILPLPVGGAVPFAAGLALFGGLAQLVPRIGPVFALLVSVAVAAAVSPSVALAVLIGGVIVHVLAHQLATRMIDSSTGRVNPLLQVLLLLALAELGGFVAMVFAPPLAALVQVLYENLRSMNIEQRTEMQVFDGLDARLSQLEAQSDPERKEFANALRRSRSLMAQARDLLDEPSA